MLPLVKHFTTLLYKIIEGQEAVRSTQQRCKDIEETYIFGRSVSRYRPFCTTKKQWIIGYAMGSLRHLDFQQNHNVPDTVNDKPS